MRNSTELAERSEDNSSAPRRGDPSRRFRCRYQPFSDKDKDAFFQRLAVSVQNPGGRSPEGFSCPAGPLRVARMCNSTELAERSEDNSSAPRGRKVRFAPASFFAFGTKAAGCVAPLLLLPAKSHAAPPLFACKRAHNAPACYQLFADKGKGVIFLSTLRFAFIVGFHFPPHPQNPAWPLGPGWIFCFSGQGLDFSSLAAAVLWPGGRRGRRLAKKFFPGHCHRRRERLN